MLWWPPHVLFVFTQYFNPATNYNYVSDEFENKDIVNRFLTDTIEIRNKNATNGTVFHKCATFIAKNSPVHAG